MPELPRTLKETYEKALFDAEREFRHAQRAVADDGSNENRARYARALAQYDRLQGMFPFVAAGECDAQA